MKEKMNPFYLKQENYTAIPRLRAGGLLYIKAY